MKLFLILFVVKLSVEYVIPPPSQAALMARYVVHNTGWISLATISTQSKIVGYPFVSLKSFSDGPDNNSTGVPYLYMTDMDVSGKDVIANNKVTIMASLAEESYCKTKNFDPQDPRCAKVMMSGRLVKIPQSSEEYMFGKQALFDKHPSMKDWPTNHNFYVAKIDLEQIEVLDFFGGIKHVTIDDYFKANASTGNNILTDFPEIVVVDIQA
ncbi:protein CREG1 [Aethina tumida]|uniref:protein CREG1 n=1 Tax=Aethina tumida TaxID=116153 RepID=UPI00096B1053|nr:protein CREG1 [Aethina tumida]